MGSVAAKMARRWRVPVRLSLDELDAVLAAAGAGRRDSRDLASARRQLDRAAERRRRAVARAAGI